MTAPDLVTAIVDVHAKNIQQFPQHTNRASSLGHPCERKLVYARIAWDKAQKVTPSKQLIFDEGKDQESRVLIDIAKTGRYQAIEQQKNYLEKKSNTTGHIDCVVYDIETGQRFPLEIKSCAPHIFMAIQRYNSDTDFMKMLSEVGKKYYWLISYACQIMFYIYAEGLEMGVILFKNKSSGQLKQFTVKLDLDYLDSMMKKAERINWSVSQHPIAGDDCMPERINDLDICQGCEHNVTCLPTLKFGADLKINDDPIFSKLIDEWLALEGQASEHKAKTEQLNELCRGVENTVVGKYHVTGKADARGYWRKSIVVVGEVVNDNF